MTKTSNESITVTFRLHKDVIDEIRRLSSKRGITMTELLRQAIGTETFMDRSGEQGCKILIEDKRGRVRQLVFR